MFFLMSFFFVQISKKLKNPCKQNPGQTHLVHGLVQRPLVARPAKVLQRAGSLGGMWRTRGGGPTTGEP